MTPPQEPHGSPKPATTPDAPPTPIIIHASVHGHAQAVIVTHRTDEAAARRAVVAPVDRQQCGKASIQ